MREVVHVTPEMILGVMNYWLKEQRFLLRNGIERMVLLSKGNSNFRMICLINAPGKFMENMVKARLESEIESKSVLFENQTGFRKKRSTVDAIIRMSEANDSKYNCGRIIALDVQNAFNTAVWS